LWGTGRDYPKEINAALKFNEGVWEYKGNADDYPELSREAGEYQPSLECQEILDVLRESKRPMMPVEIARVLGKDRGTIRSLLLKLKRREEVKDMGKGYVLSGCDNAVNSVNSVNREVYRSPLFDLQEKR
jgi:hypothetical protein